MSDDDQGYELAMPFLPVTSRGGPFDDAAYTAGFEMGSLDAKIEWAATMDNAADVYMELVLRRENVPQADLIAMRHGFRMIEGWPDGHGLPEQTVAEWARCRFEYATVQP